MSQDDYVRTALRVPPDLHKALHEAADAAGHSFNAEIIGRLQGSFGPTQSSDGTAAQELAESRGQTIIAMAFLQGSLCETVQAMFAALSPSHQRDRMFKEAAQLAASLPVLAKPADYLRRKREMEAERPNLARLVREVVDDAAAHERKEARAGKAGSSKR